MKRVINNLEDLSKLEESFPDGTVINILGEDFSAGNFDTARTEVPNGKDSTLIIDVTYTGPVKEGYVSPFGQ